MDLKELELDDKFYAKFSASMNLFEEEKFKKALIAISHKAAEVVGATIGPFAKTVIIGDGYSHYPSKDGWSVLKKITFTGDTMYNELFGIFKDVSYALANKVGDGTSTAVIAADAFINEMIAGDYSDEIAKIRQASFIDKLRSLVDKITVELEKDAAKHRIDRDGDFSDLKRIAMISSNGNEELSEIIRKIYEETRNPNIYVSIGNTDHLEYTIETGYRLTGDTIAHSAYVNNDEGTYKSLSPLCFVILDHNVNWGTHEKFILAIRQLAQKRKQRLVLIAPSYDNLTATALKATIQQFAAAGREPDICVFTAPIGMTHMRKALEDFSMLVKANVIDFTRITAFNNLVYKESGGDDSVELKPTVYDTLDEFKGLTSWQLIEQCLGVSANTIIGEDYIVIKDYDTERPEIQRLFKEARSEYEEAKAKMEKALASNDTEYLRAFNRYNRLTGSMGTISVGAGSALSQKCLKDSVDDAVLACKSAYEYGYVKGLNISCLRAIRTVSEETDDHEETIILKVLYNAIKAASIKVITNKFEDGIVSVSPEDDTLKRTDNLATANDVVVTCDLGDLVFNLITDKFEKGDATTVIQSVRTDIEVLNGLANILGLILTSSHMISTNQVYDRTDIERIEVEEKMENFRSYADIISSEIERVISSIIGSLIPKTAPKIPVPDIDPHFGKPVDPFWGPGIPWKKAPDVTCGQNSPGNAQTKSSNGVCSCNAECTCKDGLQFPQSTAERSGSVNSETTFTPTVRISSCGKIEWPSINDDTNK